MLGERDVTESGVSQLPAVFKVSKVGICSRERREMDQVSAVEDTLDEAGGTCCLPFSSD